MKRLALVAALVAVTVPVLGQVDKKVEKELQSGYAKVIAAIKKKDANAVMKSMTADATMTEMGRKMTRKEFEPMLREQIKSVDVQSSTIKFSKVTAKGGTANAEYTETMKGKMKTPDGKTAQLESTSKYKAVFKTVGGEWKLKSSETIGSPEVKLDGKPVNVPPGGN